MGITIFIRVLIQASFIMTFLGALFRWLDYKNSPWFLKLLENKIKIFANNFVMYGFMRIVYLTTLSLFDKKNKTVFRVISCVSGLGLAFGLILRVVLLTQYFVIPFSEYLLILSTINGVFRAFIGLGLVLMNNALWRALWERYESHAAQQAARRLPVQNPNSNNAQPSPGNSNFNSESHHNHHKNTEESRINWGKWGAIGSLVGGGGTVFSLILYTDSNATQANLQKEVYVLKEENIRLEEKTIRLEEKTIHLEEKTRFVEQLAESERMLFQERISNLEKENRTFTKNNNSD